LINKLAQIEKEIQACDVDEGHFIKFLSKPKFGSLGQKEIAANPNFTEVNEYV